MLEELRLNPWGPGARSLGRRLGHVAGAEGGPVGASLSTGFTERPRLRSTAATSLTAERGRTGEGVVA